MGGGFTSGLSASADPTRNVIVVSGRGTDGATYEREFTPTAASGTWSARADGPSGWSDRALGDTWPGVARLAVGAASDGRAVVQRGSLGGRHDGGVDLGRRPRVAPGRQLHHGGAGGDGALWITDGGPSSYANRSLGGVVR